MEERGTLAVVGRLIHFRSSPIEGLFSQAPSIEVYAKQKEKNNTHCLAAPVISMTYYLRTDALDQQNHSLPPLSKLQWSSYTGTVHHSTAYCSNTRCFAGRTNTRTTHTNSNISIRTSAALTNQHKNHARFLRQSGRFQDPITPTFALLFVHLQFADAGNKLEALYHRFTLPAGQMMLVISDLLFSLQAPIRMNPSPSLHHTHTHARTHAASQQYPLLASHSLVMMDSHSSVCISQIS